MRGCGQNVNSTLFYELVVSIWETPVLPWSDRMADSSFWLRTFTVLYLSSTLWGKEGREEEREREKTIKITSQHKNIFNLTIKYIAVTALLCAMLGCRFLCNFATKHDTTNKLYHFTQNHLHIQYLTVLKIIQNWSKSPYYIDLAFLSNFCHFQDAFKTLNNYYQQTCHLELNRMVQTVLS